MTPRVKLDEVALDRRLCDSLRELRGLNQIDELHITALGRMHELLVTTPEGYHARVIDFATGILQTPALRADIAAAARAAHGMAYARMEDEASLNTALVSLTQAFQMARDITGEHRNIDLIATAGLELVVVHAALCQFEQAWHTVREIDQELSQAGLNHANAVTLAREVARARKTVMDIQAAHSRAAA